MDTLTREQRQALAMLADKPHRDIYLGADGSWYVTYSDGQSPQLSKVAVEHLVKSGRIVRRYADGDYFYCLPSRGEGR